MPLSIAFDAALLFLALDIGAAILYLHRNRRLIDPF